MELIIDNKLINEPILNILHQIQHECSYNLFKDIVEKQNNVVITCPFHNDGNERTPSCQIFNKTDESVEYGTVHCFGCGYKASLPKFIADCFHKDLVFGEQWLIDHFSNIFVEQYEYLPEIVLERKNTKNISESTLKQFNYYHPYMFSRKLTKDVIDKFSIGYDRISRSIVFPVWDENNNLVMLTKRSVDTKSFNIDKGIEKPVYLYNFIKNENIQKVYVCESQINCLYAWSLGYPAIALIGTGTSHQYDILNKSGIRSYVLCFDGDEAGRKGAERFKKNIRNDVFVYDILMPSGKDLNDLSKEEFDKLVNKYVSNYCII